MPEKDKKTFPLEKILTISAIEYCNSVGKSLEDYELKGAVYNRETIKLGKGIVTEAYFPEGTEVIVGIKFTPNTLAYGTALIPKKKDNDSGGSKKESTLGFKPTKLEDMN